MIKPCKRALSTLLFSVVLITTATPQNQAVLDSLRREFDRAGSDSLRWYYGLELSAKYMRRNFDTARLYGERSLEAAQKLRSTLPQASTLNTLGSVYNFKGDQETGLRYLFQSLEISSRDGHKKMSSTTLGNIGMIYAQRGDKDRALPYLKRSLAEKTDLRDTAGMMRALSNLGMTYYNTGQPDSALLYYNQCVPLLEIKNERYGKGLVFNNIASIYLDRGDYTQALRYYTESLRLREALDDKGGMIAVLNNIATAYSKTGRHTEALAALERSLALSKEVGALPEEVGAYERLAEAYASQQQFEKAYEYLRTFASYKDTLARLGDDEKIAEMEVRYQTQQKEAELAQKQLELERQSGRQRLLLGGLLLLALAALALFQYLRYRQRVREKDAALRLRLEQTEGEKLRELDRVKSAFFANISHEFRTPLTLIISPLEQILGNTLRGDLQKYYGIMHRNARRLLELVNQLLELSKLESGKLEVKTAPGDLASFVRAIAGSFESLALRKQIRYTVEVPETPLHTNFDRDKIEKVVTNLVSNAFKFTPEEGEISVSLRHDAVSRQATLRVRDSGLGIPEKDLPHLFDHFFRATTDSDVQTGSGIGLALTKELVVLQGGRIEVESELGAGTLFTVTLPVEISRAGSQYAVETASGPAAESLGAIAAPLRDPLPPLKGGKDTLLLVEDHADVRQYIREQLDEQFHILEAVDGAEGIRLAQSEMPQLIITDRMMPDTDGLELTAQLKSDVRTSHIPIIMLTAKAALEEKLEGLETGADVYLTKPFDARELLVQAQGLLRQRRLLRERYEQAGLLPSEVAVNSVDQQFLAQVRQAVEDNLDDETFGVVELGDRLALSRSQLHRKLKALTGHGPNEIIRHMRLERGRELLEKRAGNASEVAFMVGFNSLAYFSKCFSEYFGYSPSEVLEKKKLTTE